MKNSYSNRILIKRNIIIFFACLFHISNPAFSFSEFDIVIPLIDKTLVLEYKGAFRLPTKKFGTSKLLYPNGTITVSPKRNSFFIVGHKKHNAIAEFPLIEFSKSNNFKKLPTVDEPIQNFNRIIKRIKSNPEKINRITGMDIINQKLIINAVRYYDARGKNADTTLIVDNVFNLKNAQVSAFYKLQGKAHASGWISKVPYEWQNKINGTYITGFSDHLPIASRSSIGPSAFSFYTENILPFQRDDNLIATNRLLDFNLKNTLSPNRDRDNESGNNKLWTSVSAARYGFIIPGTATYFVIGSSGGHKGGVGYKITQDNGNKCGGHCTHMANDHYNHVWLWDVKKLIRTKEQDKPPHVKPYAYQKIKLPFENLNFKQKENYKPNLLIGADYDELNNMLYIMLDGNNYNKRLKVRVPPIMLSYKLKLT